MTILVTGAVLLIFAQSPPIQSGDLDMRDILFQIRGEIDLSDSDIVIVEISQQADAEIPYKYPWPAYVYAKLVENLNKAGARAIAFDIMFDQPDLYDARNDSIFAAAVVEAQNVVFIGGFRRQADRRAGSFLIENIAPVFPRNDLLDATPWKIGFVDMRRDLDGAIRTYPLQLNYQNVPYFSLALQMIPLVLNEDVSYVNEKNHYVVAGRRLPKTYQGRMLINYYGGYRSFNYVSLESVVDDKEFQTTTERMAFEVNEFDDPDYGLLYQGILQDKIILIGATMPELQDFHQVPFPNSSGDKTMAGVEIHAHALQTLIDESFLKELSPVQNLLISFLILLLAFLITLRLVGWGGLISAFFMGLGWGLFSVLVFIQFNTFLPVLPAFLAILLGYTGSTMQNVLSEMRQKTMIKSMFSSYVSPELVEKMVSDDISFKLGGSLENLTVLFTDIENFTSLSESLEPEELVGIMNNYLGEISDVINHNNGTLDKFIGDAVMAFYGAPIPSETHPADACRTVLLSGFDWKGTTNTGKVIEIKTRYGLNTGSMLVGNMGSEKRFNYTVMGDQVNVAARSESACKLFGVYAVVSESTKIVAEQSDEFLFRKLGRVRVKGRKEPVWLYQLVSFKKEAPEKTIELISIFEEALDLYFDRKFSRAQEKFEDITEFETVYLHSDEKNNPSQFYIKKCKEMILQIPAKEWQGVVDG